MTKHAKITLSGARDIPFSALMLSQANVRRVKAGVSIDGLAADIERRGLLQSLTVRAQRDDEGNETGRYEVPAGGRRFRALQQLVKQRRMAKTEPVPCIVRDDDAVSAEEDSLAENVHREPLHPLDQFRAMQKLVEQGSDIETVAATFMVTPAVVKQRLKLADVSPKLHDIYAEDGMTLDQLMAFSVASDHARQEQVWDMLQTSHNLQPWFIRARLAFDGHVTQVRPAWSPWPHVRKGIYDRDAVPLLNSTIRKCVSAWAKERKQIMLELSGGLDSSIVAAALAAEDHGFAAATIATVSPDGDERRYARAVAERCGASLSEYVHDDSELDLAAGPQFISPRPATYGVLAGIDAALGAATAQLPGASIFTGIGGDNVFAITRSILPVIDAFKVREPIRRPAAALRDCARLCDVTIWHAARAVYRHWRRPLPTGWPREDEYCCRSALHDAPLPHPWDHGGEGIPPGKIRHVQSIQRILDFLDRPGRWYGRDVVAPLLSQPVVELCLSIPGWQWVAGGRDRAAAREAFASRLPDFVVWRRNKGRLETLCAKAFIEQRARLRPILLEGRLAREGLLDRERIEAYLARERLAGDYDYFRLLELADIELWIASTEGFGRVPASLAQRAY